jgi:hypothetical protein
MKKQLIKKLIREALKQKPKKGKCSCGCNSCGEVGPTLNENLNSRIVITENMKKLIESKHPIVKNDLVYGSKEFLDLWVEARQLYSRNIINLNENDKQIITKTNIGEYGIFENKKVPLDLPIPLEEEEDSKLGSKLDNIAGGSYILPYQELLNRIEEDWGRKDLYYEIETALFDKDIKKAIDILRDWEVYDDYISYLNLNEIYNKIYSGESNKIYVYYRNPSNKKIQKLIFK